MLSYSPPLTLPQRLNSSRHLDRTYTIPGPGTEWERSHHRDLPSLSDDDLGCEYRLVRGRLDLGREIDFAADRDWLRGRLDAVRAEEDARRRMVPATRSRS